MNKKVACVTGETYKQWAQHSSPFSTEVKDLLAVALMTRTP